MSLFILVRFLNFFFLHKWVLWTQMCSEDFREKWVFPPLILDSSVLSCPELDFTPETEPIVTCSLKEEDRGSRRPYSLMLSDPTLARRPAAPVWSSVFHLFCPRGLTAYILPPVCVLSVSNRHLCSNRKVVGRGCRGKSTVSSRQPEMCTSDAGLLSRSHQVLSRATVSSPEQVQRWTWGWPPASKPPVILALS